MRHLLTGTLMLSLLGCAGAQSSGAAPASPAAATQTKADALGLQALQVTDAVMFRDGGSIELTGRTQVHTNLLIRYDGKHGSETQGTVFISPDGQEASLRPMTRAEVDALLSALRQPSDPPATVDPLLMQTLADHLETYRTKAP